MSKALINRIVSSIIMIVIVGTFIFISSELGVTGRIIGLTVCLALGLYVFTEAVLVSIKKYKYFLIFGILSILVVFALDYNLLINIIQSRQTINDEFKKIFSWWTFIIPFLFIIPIMFLKSMDDDVTTNNIFFVIMLVILITLFTKIIFILSVIHWTLICFVIIIAIIFDSTAYAGGILLGRKFIKYPFTPRLSPKKSWEGFIIGYLCTGLFIGLYGYFFHIFRPTSSEIAWLCIAVILLPLACQVGDIFFSSIKRTKNIKDFSSLIPGHGGLMDRIDGLIFVVIMFATVYGISLIGVLGGS